LLLINLRNKSKQSCWTTYRGSQNFAGKKHSHNQLPSARRLANLEGRREWCNVQKWEVL